MYSKNLMLDFQDSAIVVMVSAAFIIKITFSTIWTFSYLKT